MFLLLISTSISFNLVRCRINYNIFMANRYLLVHRFDYLTLFGRELTWESSLTIVTIKCFYLLICDAKKLWWPKAILAVEELSSNIKILNTRSLSQWSSVTSVCRPDIHNNSYIGSLLTPCLEGRLSHHTLYSSSSRSQLWCKTGKRPMNSFKLNNVIIYPRQQYISSDMNVLEQSQ